MASTTAEVMLYFGTDNRKFADSVSSIRFDGIHERSVREIIEIIKPFYHTGYDEGWDEGRDQFNDGA